MPSRKLSQAFSVLGFLASHSPVSYCQGSMLEGGAVCLMKESAELQGLSESLRLDQ